MLIFALGTAGEKLNNPVTSFISSISLEIYLSHMVVFRIAEKLHLNTMFGNGVLQYVITVLIVFAGTVIFSFAVKKAFEFLGNKFTLKKTGEKA